MAYPPQPHSNPFAAHTQQSDVDTTFTPAYNSDGIVPSVVPPAPQTYSQQPAQAPVVLQFTEPTSSPYQVSGNIQQQNRPAIEPDPGNNSNFNPGQPSSSAPVPEREKEDPSKYAFYNLRKYRPYFDVDTKDVLWRITNSLLGPFRSNFIETTGDSPDLYGPFWVATTLIFITAVAGNWVKYMSYVRAETPSPPPPFPPPIPDAPPAPPPASTKDISTTQWFNDPRTLSYSALLFYGYVSLVGLAVYFFLRWFKAEVKLVTVWCIYGYSLSVFIPISLLSIIPVAWLRWILIMVGTVSSALFICMNFRQAVYAVAPARATAAIITMFILHCALGLSLKLYFFQYFGRGGA